MKIGGLRVINAPRSATIHINGNDIKNGKRKNPAGCAAALACKRELKATDARVHVGRTYLRFNGHWERYLTSHALRSEVIAVDRGGAFAPGEYTLTKMQKSKQTNKRQGSNLDQKSKNPKKRSRPYHTTSGVRTRGANV